LEEAHSLASKIESCLKDSLVNVDATIHIEPSDKGMKMDEVVQKLASVEGVKEVHEISTIFVGGKLYITLHVYVNPEMTLEEAHKIAETIEQNMHSEIKQLENVTVHVEPAGVAIPAIKVTEAQIRGIVNDVAKGIAFNLRIKRVVTYDGQGKRYINIDCCFTKQIRVKEAHRIASLIEKGTKDRFAGAVVTVHMEPECI
jgi:divalent metal cation (Fe/Co/Zn/Cd) transporter